MVGRPLLLAAFGPSRVQHPRLTSDRIPEFRKLMKILLTLAVPPGAVQERTLPQPRPQHHHQKQYLLKSTTTKTTTTRVQEVVPPTAGCLQTLHNNS